MNELIYQPLFDGAQNPNGCVWTINMFGLSGAVFSFGKSSTPTSWRNELKKRIFHILFDSVRERINENKKWVEYEWMRELNRANLYVYSHSPAKENGYVRILTEPDKNESGKLRVIKTDYYPDEVGNAGPVERFLFDNGDNYWATVFWDLPLEVITSPMGKEDYSQYCWEFGDGLQLAPDIYNLYFNNTPAWDDLYWKLCNSIGRPWKKCSCLDVWRERGLIKNKTLFAEHDGQRLLFWCIENDYTLEDLNKMVAEKRIETKRFLSTIGDWTTTNQAL